MKYKAAIAIVKDRNNRILLGLCKNDDFRNNRWCFPGGHIENGETPKQAAVREVFEETGIRCKPDNERKMFTHDRKDIIFVCCKAISDLPKDSEEMTHIGFFSRKEIRSLRTTANVVDILNNL